MTSSPFILKLVVNNTLVHVRQFGRLEYDSTSEMMNVSWVARAHLGELVAPFAMSPAI